MILERNRCVILIFSSKKGSKKRKEKKKKKKEKKTQTMFDVSKRFNSSTQMLKALSQTSQKVRKSMHVAFSTVNKLIEGKESSEKCGRSGGVKGERKK